jgi:hypothetical protein
MKIPSKEQLDNEKPKFSLLPQDDYRLRISEVRKETQKKYQSTETEIVYNIIFDVISLKDGSTASDVDGKALVNRKVFFTARPESIGFRKDGTPSKTRQLLAYATDQDVLEEIEVDSWESLEGKLVNAEIIQYVKDNKEKSNKIGRFLPVKNRKKVEEEIPVVEESSTNEEDSSFENNSSQEEDEIDVKDIPL